MEQLYVLLD